MSIEVATWNLAKGLGTERQAQIFEGIKRLDSQTIVFSEAFRTTSVLPDEKQQQNDDIIGAIEDFSLENGYEQVISYPYADFPKPSEALDDEVYGLVLSRTALNLDNTEMIRLGGRNALSLEVICKIDESEAAAVQVIAAHLDDRNEDLRRMAIDSLPNYLIASRPKVMLGDFNAMHGDTTIARLLRTKPAKVIANNSFPKRARTITTRAVEMANGSTMARLEAMDYRDADRFSQATFKLGGLAIGQLDHILVANSESMHIVAEQAKIFNLKGSDHKAILSVIHVDHKIIRDPFEYKPRI